MDFVISKVCLSICALLLLVTIGGTFDEPLSSAELREIMIVADRFDDLILTLVERGCEAKHVYRMPSLASGSAITMTLRTSGLEIQSENARHDVALSYPLHLWEWNLTELNQSDVEWMDSSAWPLAATSGELLRIEVMKIPIQGVATMMVFLTLADGRASIALQPCPPAR